MEKILKRQISSDFERKTTYIPVELTPVQMYKLDRTLYCYDGKQLYEVSVDNGYDGAMSKLSLSPVDEKDDAYIIY